MTQPIDLIAITGEPLTPDEDVEQLRAALAAVVEAYDGAGYPRLTQAIDAARSVL